jgi:hypothetical protein
LWAKPNQKWAVDIGDAGTREGWKGHYCKIRAQGVAFLSPLALAYANDLGGAERVEAVHESDAGMALPSNFTN